VLVVDGMWHFCGWARSVLTRAGYDVLEAKTPSAAREIVERERGQIDCVVCEVNFRDRTDGPILMVSLWKMDDALKVIFVSGYDRSTCKLEVGDEFLQKPFRPRELVALVREMISRRERM